MTTNAFENVPLTMLEPHEAHQLRWGGVDEDDRSLLQSIDQFGVLMPLVVEAETYRIVQGHRRYEAAKAIGLSAVPCVVHPRMSAAEYERMRFVLQHSWKPLTKKQLQRLERSLRNEGVDVKDDLVLAA